MLDLISETSETCPRCGELRWIPVVDADTGQCLDQIPCDLCSWSREPRRVVPPLSSDDSVKPWGGPYRLWPPGATDAGGIPVDLVLLRHALLFTGVPLGDLELRYRQTPFGTDMHVLLLSESVSPVALKQIVNPFHRTETLRVARRCDRVDVCWSPSLLHDMTRRLGWIQEDGPRYFEVGPFAIHRLPEPDAGFEWTYRPELPSLALEQIRACRSLLMEHVGDLGIPLRPVGIENLKQTLVRLLSLVQRWDALDQGGFQEDSGGDGPTAADGAVERLPSAEEIQWVVDAHEDPSRIEVDTTKPVASSDGDHVWVRCWVRVPASP